MTIIAIKRRVGLLNPDLALIRSAANACCAAWSLPAPTIKLYWLRKPRGSWRIVWSNKLPPGAAGVHLDSNRLPYALIASNQGMDVVAHEALEMLVDPYGTRFVIGPSIRTSRPVDYLVEVCDPCERRPYAFVEPSFYAQPFVEPGGYISWIEDGAWWQAYADHSGTIDVVTLGAAVLKTRHEKNELST